VNRKWLEKLSKERDFSWQNEEMTLDKEMFEKIPSGFKNSYLSEAENAIQYDGFDDYLSLKKSCT
jgi:hypothetical protein